MLKLTDQTRTALLKALYISLFVHGFLIIAPMSFGPITGLGPWSATGSELALIFVPLIIAIAITAGTILLFFSRHRQKGSKILITALVLAIFFVPAIIASYELRSFGFYITAKRAEPLVASVKKYQMEKGDIPSSFDVLIPTYIPKVPYGMPPLEIHRGSNGKDWSLRASVGIGLLNWDEFIYRSDQDYSDSSYERLGDWAYFHE